MVQSESATEPYRCCDGTASGDMDCWDGDLNFAECGCTEPVDCAGSWGSCDALCERAYSVSVHEVRPVHRIRAREPAWRCIGAAARARASRSPMRERERELESYRFCQVGDYHIGNRNGCGAYSPTTVLISLRQMRCPIRYSSGAACEDYDNVKQVHHH